MIRWTLFAGWGLAGLSREARIFNSKGPKDINSKYHTE
jgi:hypothetical protein